MSALENTLKKKFSHRDGPFFRCLEESLQQLNVKRQSFHGATFVGNHVHKLLQVCTHTLCTGIGFKSNFMQPKSIETVCNNIKKLSNSALQQPIESVTTQFTTVLTLFSKCHHGYNSSKFMSDEDIKQLGRIIQMYLK